jgi:hypothetical protein
MWRTQLLTEVSDMPPNVCPSRASSQIRSRACLIQWSRRVPTKPNRGFSVLIATIICRIGIKLAARTMAGRQPITRRHQRRCFCASVLGRQNWALGPLSKATATEYRCAIARGGRPAERYRAKASQLLHWAIWPIASPCRGWSAKHLGGN